MSQTLGTRDVVMPFVCNLCRHSASAVFAIQSNAQSRDASDVARRSVRRAEIEALLIRCPGCGKTDLHNIRRYRLHQLNGALATFVFAAILSVAGYALGNAIPSRRIKISVFFAILALAMVVLMLRNLFRAFVIRPALVRFTTGVERVASASSLTIDPEIPVARIAK